MRCCRLRLSTATSLGLGGASRSVAIVGDGFVELLLAQLGADAGAHVLVLSDRQEILRLAEAMDAEETLEITYDGCDARRALEVMWVWGLTA